MSVSVLTAELVVLVVVESKSRGGADKDQLFLRMGPCRNVGR